MRRTLAILALAAPAAFCFAEPISDTELETLLGSHSVAMQSIIEAYQQDQDYDKAIAAVGESVNGILGKMDLSDLTADQLGELANAQGFLEYASGEPALALRERVRVLIDESEGTDELKVMTIALSTPLGEPDDEWVGYLAKLSEGFRDHPALKEMMMSADADLAIGAYFNADFEDATAAVVGLMDLLGDEPDASAATSAMQIWQRVENIEGIDPEVRERARALAADWMARGVEFEKAQSEPETPKIDWMEGQVAMLNSPAVTGKLIGYEAPDIDFFWSTEEGLTSLDDLKGKVVVVDFWATWCGPCIDSFPNVRALRDRYPEEHVAIIGVSSIQGAIHGMPGGERMIDCDGDPEKELRLMGEYAEKMDISWTLAMSDQNVFNPDFGVRGIPHVAILDAEGKVRFNGLHPMDQGKNEKIDDLLEEAGLPVPEVEG